jgi:ubiquinone/menaquinone biosynthesis C-methylase UbiE
LDIGCGTGQSSIALAHYCEAVIGVDPSEQMLSRALKSPKVTYQYMLPDILNFNNALFDIITFAGSLYYAKSQSLLNESIRVCKPKGQILVYDFDIPLEETLNAVGLSVQAKPVSSYDHEINFSELDTSSLKMNKKVRNQSSIAITLTDLAHLLLSEKDIFNLLQKTYEDENLYDIIVEKLRLVLKSENTTLRAMTYMTHYEVIK